MKKLKRPTITKCDEQSGDDAAGKLLPKITKVDKAKVHPSSKLCELCQKRLWVNRYCGKWCCRTCRSRASRQKTESKKPEKDDLENTNITKPIKDIFQSGAFKSTFTIQIQSDGKRCVKANPDYKELSSEKKLSTKKNCTKRSEVTSSIVIGKTSDNNKGNVLDKEKPLNSSTRCKIPNGICFNSKQSNFTNLVAEKSEISQTYAKVNFKERMNGISEVTLKNKYFSIDSSNTNKDLEKPSYEFPLKPDSSLFDCVETCFSNLEEVDLKLFLEYICKLKKSDLVHINSKLNEGNALSIRGSKGDFDHNKQENDQNFTDNLRDESEASSNMTEGSNPCAPNNDKQEKNNFNKETSVEETLLLGKSDEKQMPVKVLPSPSMPNSNKQVINNVDKETLFVDEETSVIEKNTEKQLSSKQKKSLHANKGSVPRSSNVKKKSFVSEIVGESDHHKARKKNVGDLSSSLSSTKCKSPCSKEDKGISSTNLLSDSLSFSKQNESHSNQCNDENLSLQNISKSPKKKVAVDNVNLAMDSNRAILTNHHLPIIENNVSNKCFSDSVLTENQVSSDDKGAQFSAFTLKERTEELNLACIESETQHSSGKSSVSNDLYSQETEALDYEPEDETVSPVETLKFTDEFEVSEFQKADFNDIMHSLEDENESHLFNTSTHTINDDKNKKKSSVWEVNSDEEDLDCGTKDVPPTSSPELLCTVDEDEENYIETFSSHQSTNKSEAASCTSVSLSDMSSVNENLKNVKHNTPSKNECRNVQPFTLNDSISKSHQKQISSDNTTAAPQNANFVRLDYSKLRRMSICFNFAKSGTCNRKLCRFRHIQPLPPSSSEDRIFEHPQHNQHSGQNHYSERGFTKDNNFGEGNNLGSRMERANRHIITDRNTDQYARQFGTCANDRQEINPMRQRFQNTNNYQTLEQRHKSISELIFENEWTVLSGLFDYHFCDGAFVKHLKTALCHQQCVGSKYEQLVHFVTGKQELQREKIYVLGQIGCSIILEAHSEGRFEAAFEILQILHQYDINYYYLQHNIKQCLEFPLWGIITPSWIALIAVDVCGRLEKIVEANQILEGCDWAMPSAKLTPEIKKKEIIMRINVFQELIKVAAKKNMTSFAIEILKKILDSFAGESGESDMRDFMSGSIKQVHIYYVSMFIELQDFETAMSLYMYYWKLKLALEINSEIHRAFIVLAIRNNNKAIAQGFFQTCANMGIYKIAEPNLSSLPPCLRVETSWTSEEMHLALNHYLEQLLNCLFKWKNDFNKISSQELFSLHIVFKESQNTEYLFDFLSPVRLCESRERIIAAIKKLTYSLEFEQKTERTIHIKPSSLHSYFLLWKMDKDVKVPDSFPEKNNKSFSVKTDASNFSSSSQNSNFPRYTDMTEAVNSTSGELNNHIAIDAVYKNTYSSYTPNSSPLSAYYFPDHNTTHRYDCNQAVDHSSQKSVVTVTLQNVPGTKSTLKDLSDSHSSFSSFNNTEHLSAKKTIQCIASQRNRNVSTTLDSHLKPPPLNDMSLSTSESSVSSICANKQLQHTRTIQLTPVSTKKAFVPQTSQNRSSNMIAKNKTALAKKYLNTPRKSNEKMKTKQRLIASLHDMKDLPVQKAGINLNSFDSSKIYNYIKSQLLCHHKGDLSIEDLNRQAQELTKEFLSVNLNSSSANSLLLDKKRMKTLVHFTKLHLNKGLHLT